MWVLFGKENKKIFQKISYKFTRNPTATGK